jgi:hypothetical protein
MHGTNRHYLWFSCDCHHWYKPFKAPSDTGLQRGIAPRARGWTVKLDTWDLGPIHLTLLPIFLCPSPKTMVSLPQISLTDLGAWSQQNTLAFNVPRLLWPITFLDFHQQEKVRLGTAHQVPELCWIWPPFLAKVHLTRLLFLVCFLLNYFLLGSFCYSQCFDCEPRL